MRKLPGHLETHCSRPSVQTVEKWAISEAEEMVTAIFRPMSLQPTEIADLLPAGTNSGIC